MEEPEEVETGNVTTEELLNLIGDVNDIHEQLKEVEVLKYKLKYAKKALQFAEKKSEDYQDLLRKADSENYELKQSQVTLEQYNNLQKEFNDLQSENHNLVNWAEIRYQKVNQELVTMTEQYDLVVKENYKLKELKKYAQEADVFQTTKPSRPKPKKNKELKVQQEIVLEESQKVADLQQILTTERNKIRQLSSTLYSLQERHDELIALKEELQKQMAENNNKHQEIILNLRNQLRNKDEEIRILVQESNLFKKDQMSLPVLLDEPSDHKKTQENPDQLLKDRSAELQQLVELKQVLKLERDRVKELTTKLNALKKHEQTEIKGLNNQLKNKIETIDALNNQLKNKDVELEKTLEELTALQLQINLSKDDSMLVNCNTIEVENYDVLPISNELNVQNDDGDTSDPPSDEIDSILTEMRHCYKLISPLPIELPKKSPQNKATQTLELMEPTPTNNSNLEVSTGKNGLLTAEPKQNLRMLHHRKRELLITTRKLRMMKKKLNNTKRECCLQNKELHLTQKELRIIKNQTRIATKKLRMIKHYINLKKSNPKNQDQSTQCCMTNKTFMEKIVKKPRSFNFKDGLLSYPSAESDIDYGPLQSTVRRKKFRKLRQKPVINNSSDDEAENNKKSRKLRDRGTNTDSILNEAEGDPGNASSETIYAAIQGSVDSGYVKTDTGGETEEQNKKLKLPQSSVEICKKQNKISSKIIKTQQENPAKVKHRTKSMIKLFGSDSDSYASCLEAKPQKLASKSYLERIEAEKSLESSDTDFLKGFSNGCYSSVPKNGITIRKKRENQEIPCRRLNIDLISNDLSLSEDFCDKTRNPLVDDGLQSLTCTVISNKPLVVPRKSFKKIKCCVAAATKMVLRSADKKNKSETGDKFICCNEDSGCKGRSLRNNVKVANKSGVDEKTGGSGKKRVRNKSETENDNCGKLEGSLGVGKFGTDDSNKESSDYIKISAKKRLVRSNSETGHKNSVTISQEVKRRHSIAAEKSEVNVSIKEPPEPIRKSLRISARQNRIRCNSETSHKNPVAISKHSGINGRRHSTNSIAVSNKIRPQRVYKSKANESRNNEFQASHEQNIQEPKASNSVKKCVDKKNSLRRSESIEENTIKNCEGKSRSNSICAEKSGTDVSTNKCSRIRRRSQRISAAKFRPENPLQNDTELQTGNENNIEEPTVHQAPNLSSRHINSDEHAVSNTDSSNIQEVTKEESGGKCADTRNGLRRSKSIEENVSKNCEGKNRSNSICAEKSGTDFNSNKCSKIKRRSQRLSAGKHRSENELSNDFQELTAQQAPNISTKNINTDESAVNNNNNSDKIHEVNKEESDNIKKQSTGKKNGLRKSQTIDEHKPIAKKRRLSTRIAEREGKSVIDDEKCVDVSENSKTQAEMNSKKIITKDKELKIIDNGLNKPSSAVNITVEEEQPIITNNNKIKDQECDELIKRIFGSPKNEKIQGKKKTLTAKTKSDETMNKHLEANNIISPKLNNYSPIINGFTNEQVLARKRTAHILKLATESNKSTEQLSFKRPNTRRIKPASFSTPNSDSELSVSVISHSVPQNVNILLKSSLDHNINSNLIPRGHPAEKAYNIVALDESVASSDLPASPTLQNPDNSLDFESPASPSSYSDHEELFVVHPKIIPLEEVQYSENKGRAISLSNQILHYCKSGDMAEAVANGFLCENPHFIAKLILGVISQDTHSKIEIFNYRRAPLLSLKQRLMLGLLMDLEEKGLKGVISNFLSLSEQHLVTLKEPLHISAVARLHSAICKIQFDYTRMRLMLCKAIFFMDDAAVPYLYIVLCSWLELLPLNNDLLSACDALQTRTLVQIIRLKQCTEPKYNLHNLQTLLHSYYGYPFDREDSEKLLEDLFKSYMEKKGSKLVAVTSESIMYLIVALCKSLEKNFVFKQLDKLKVRLVIITENDQIYAIIYLIGIITLQYNGDEDVCENVKDNKEWLQNFCDDTYPEYIKNAAMDVLRKL